MPVPEFHEGGGPSEFSLELKDIYTEGLEAYHVSHRLLNSRRGLSVEPCLHFTRFLGRKKGRCVVLRLQKLQGAFGRGDMTMHCVTDHYLWISC